MSIRKHKIINVTPEIAKRFLEKNTRNRPLRPGIVEKYTDIMRRGQWQLTPEAVQFTRPHTDAAGVQHGEVLQEGQHRLLAIIASGATVPLTVWWGCEPQEFDVIGTGCARTMGDTLATTRTDLKDPTIVASVCSSIVRYGFGQSQTLTKGSIDLLLKHFESDIIAVVGYKKKLRKLATRPVVSALFLARLICPSQVDIIVDQLKSAVGFTEQDPIRALHAYLNQCLASSTRDSTQVIHYKVCHALAAKMRGDHFKKLRLCAEGLAFLRDGARARISPVVMALNDGKTPHSFYAPRLMIDDAAD